ncbi:hypothetical protein BB560_003314 [Smittium megazygosporum]|uniref:DUF3074 domain-containing protein n=1 Tax=Smittium megazygosporum TaxID=133381 RepID=A0A2T9ZCH3_9FUNG|nr:hypothetical protein BB560_003314 [Smittium megazygosporum]
MVGVLKPIRYSIIPSSEKELAEFILEWEHRCNDLVFYSSKWPVLKTNDNIVIRKKVRDIEEEKFWFSRVVRSNDISYNSIKDVFFSSSESTEKLINSKITFFRKVEELPFNMAEVQHTGYSSRWGGHKRDFCSLVFKNETTDIHKAQPRGLYTPTASFANLNHTHNLPSQIVPSVHPKPLSSPSSNSSGYILRKFQVISVPLDHPKCQKTSGYTRALFESYNEIRECSDGSIEWITVQNYLPNGWVLKSFSKKAFVNEMILEANVISKLCSLPQPHSIPDT